MRSTPTILLFVAVGIAPRIVVAQPMTPTETQRNYNDRGVQHMFDGEYEQASANFKSSLSLGESNIAWLNYGRALFKLGRCHESEAAYGQVGSAPQVASPSPSELETVLTKFDDEWAAICTGALVLECPEETTEVRLDGGEPFACHDNAIPTTIGLHEVAIAKWDETFTVKVEAEPAMLSLQRSLAAPPGDELDTAPEPTSEESIRFAGRDGGSRRLIGATLAATGLVAVGTGLVLEAFWVAPAFTDYKAAQTPEEYAAARDVVRGRQGVNRVLLIAGVGATAVGATMYLWPSKRDGVAMRFGLTGPTSVGAEVRW